MPDAELQVRRRYSRSDPAGALPRVTGLPDLRHNRLGLFWRPMIDLVDSELAPMRLQFVAPVSAWLAEADPGRWSWFAMIGLSGQRHQVIRHAGLDRYDCPDPAGLPVELRSSRWNLLLDRLAGFGGLPPAVRSLVVFQLAQLSYCRAAIRLAGTVRPDGDPAHDRYAYEVARVHARQPGYAPRALEVFEAIARTATDPRLALAACGQGIGHSIRSGTGAELARRFAGMADEVRRRGLGDGWHARLVGSRYHRAVALLRLVEGRAEDMRRELDRALALGDEVLAGAAPGTDTMVALENRRILVESQIKAVCRARGPESAEQVRQLCAEMARLDPYCIETRLVVGDGYAEIGDPERAALWFTRAGELGTAAGAIGWYRAAQCHDFLGDRAGAVNAMGRCLELDPTAIEPRQYLDQVRGNLAIIGSPPTDLVDA